MVDVRLYQYWNNGSKRSAFITNIITTTGQVDIDFTEQVD